MTATMKKIFFVAPHPDYEIGGPHVASIYLEPLVDKYGSDAFYLARNEEDIRNANLDELSPPLVIGALPDYLKKSDILNGQYIHIVVDKYIFNALEFAGDPKLVHASAILDLIYGKSWPRVIYTNNSAMKKHFENAVGELNKKIDVGVIQHPISHMARSAYEVLDKCCAGEGENKLLLDSGGGLHFDRMSDDLAAMCKESVLHVPWHLSPTEKEKRIGSINIVGLINYRPTNSSLTSREKPKKSRMKLRTREIRTALKQAYNLYYVLIVSWFRARKNAFKSRESLKIDLREINAEWKPSTKVSSAIAQGLPLVTESEASLAELAETVGFPLYLYSDPYSFKEVCSMLANDESHKKSVLSQRSKWIDMIQNEYVDCIESALELKGE